LRLMGRQLRRWSHGFVQNVRLHGRGILRVPFLRFSVAVAIWDATVATVGYLLVLPLLALMLAQPWPLLGYALDIPALAVPVLAGAAARKELRRAAVSLPCFLLLRFVNAAFFLEALWSELVRRRPFMSYEKGH
jgi:biofilm PGA synthesis N-glycosyltransferase PgaC